MIYTHAHTNTNSRFLKLQRNKLIGRNDREPKLTTMKCKVLLILEFTHFWWRWLFGGGNKMPS